MLKLSERVSMAISLINHILTIQSPEDQRAVLSDLFKRYHLEENGPILMRDTAVAETYGVTVKTVQDWLTTGDLKGYKDAKKWYSRSDWLREREDRLAGKRDGKERRTKNSERQMNCGG